MDRAQSDVEAKAELQDGELENDGIFKRALEDVALAAILSPKDTLPLVPLEDASVSVRPQGNTGVLDAKVSVLVLFVTLVFFAYELKLHRSCAKKLVVKNI